MSSVCGVGIGIQTWLPTLDLCAGSRDNAKDPQYVRERILELTGGLLGFFRTSYLLSLLKMKALKLYFSRSLEH